MMSTRWHSFPSRSRRPAKTLREVKQLIMTKLADRRIAFDEQKSVDGKNILLRISAIFEALCIEAERLHIKRFSKKKVTNDDKFGDIPFGDSLIPQVAISVERVAAQFAFNEYLIKSLSILALVGIVVFVLDQLVDVVIIFVRSSIFDRLWRRKNARSLYDTNSLKPTEPDMIRPVFIGRCSSQTSPATERVYPPDSNAIFLALSIAGQWATVFYEADLVSTFHPGLINGVLQMVLWSLYGRVAVWLTEADLGRASNEDELFKQLTLRANILLILQSVLCGDEHKHDTTNGRRGRCEELGRRPVALQHPTPGMDLMSQDLYSQTQSRLNTMGRQPDDVRGPEGEERKVEEEGQAVHQNDCGATRADAGAAGEAEGVQEYENEYNKRMSEVEFEQSKASTITCSNRLLHSDLAPLVPRGSHQRRARHPLRAVQAAQHKATPDPVDSPKHVVDGNVDHDDHLGLHPAHHTRAVLLFPRQADRPLHGRLHSNHCDNAAFVFFIQFLAALALENLFLAVRAAIALSVNCICSNRRAEFRAIKLKVGFILIFDDIIGLKMQQSIYLRSEVRHIKLLYVDY
ncbi:hypothetical protein BLNAU_1168 [Blattamonas nauphoetae]|uniref:Anoctamin transmembrane domain-containing protein n=1 Tax=Blattamonas nauphoetae TaxID=2049346 RepID=A0ABQ9YIL6_9EUKA|nr:hypothetical protein BLNAU_1168 [Blattamonas nauphoetae]